MKFKIKHAALALIFTCAIILSAGVAKNMPSSIEPLKSEKAAVQAVKGDEPMYTLRAYKGYVAVFTGSQTENPLKITDIETKTLSDYDRKLLQKGIAAKSKTELIMLLEDFSA